MYGSHLRKCDDIRVPLFDSDREALSHLNVTPSRWHTVFMANRTVVPDATTLRRYLKKGLTQAQIADAWEADSGVRVSRSAIAMAIARYGLETPRPRRRNTDLLPWVLKKEHQMATEARLLRMEGRRRRGEPLSKADLTWVSNWVEELRRDNAVITYLPNTKQGFHRVARTKKDGDSLIRP